MARSSKTGAQEYIRTIGRRKSAVAIARLTKTKGTVTVNGKTIQDYFRVPELQRLVEEPLRIANLAGLVQVAVTAKGGGLRGQAEAVRMALARSVAKLDSSQAATLRAKDLLTRDSREKERKKFGLKKARRAPQCGKR